MINNRSQRRIIQSGFTIVELLVVIVVIGILAAISIVAFNGVQNRAKEGIIQAELKQAGTKMALYAVDNSDTFPGNIGAVGVSSKQNGTTYEYSVNNQTSPASYCLTGSRDNIRFYISSTQTSPASGVCPGHSTVGSAYPQFQIANLIPGDLIADDTFGDEVAISGDIAAVAAFNQNSSRGSVYIFARSGGTWTQQAKITASDGVASDIFGVSIAISGETVVVGANGDESFRGAAYVFTRSGSTWTQQAKLTASDGIANDFFGQSIAISSDTVVVGSIGNASSRGAAYVFTRSGSTWTQQAKLTASDGVANDIFGHSLSISNGTLAIGASRDDSSAGSAYIFTGSGNTWTQQAKLVASDRASNDRFGASISILGDTVVVPALLHNSFRGAVYVYTRVGSTWTQQTKLTQSDPDAFAFGHDVSISNGTIAIGAPYTNEYTGAVYVYTGSGSTWTQQAAIVVSNGVEYDEFGENIALDNGTLLVGAYGANNYTGSAYIFE